MCRLFGFRSVLQSGVHRSLMSADNALSVQSEMHPDGWGVAYYIGGAPHLIKSANQAVSDRLFHRVSGIVSSETVVAHIRKATQGEHSPINAHPFQFGPWIFAHNGNIRDFPQLRAELMARVSPRFRPFVLGDTDSEVLFYLVLSRMAERFNILEHRFQPMDIVSALQEALGQVCVLTDGFHRDTNGPPTETYLTCIITNGRVMVAHQGGKELYYSTHKTLCPERDTCPFLSASCERSSQTGDSVNHLIISSEPMLGENIWNAMTPGELVFVDQEMTLGRHGDYGMTAARI